MPRYFYYSEIQTFLNESDDQIFGKLAGRDEYDSARTPEFYDGTYQYLKSLGFIEL